LPSGGADSQPINEDAVARAIPNARIGIAEIGRLAGRPHMDGGGHALSLADLLLAPHLSMWLRRRRVRKYCGNTEI
jgi:hypothetical protein